MEQTWKERLNSNLNKLDQIKKSYSAPALKKSGWDVDPIPNSLIRYCQLLIRCLMGYQPEVVPGPGGFIQFEYDKPDGSYFEVEIYPSGKFQCLWTSPDKEDREYEIARRKLILKKEVAKFFHGSVTL